MSTSNPPNKFFGGIGVSAATIWSLQARNWKEFVEGYILIPHTINVTREEFLASDKETRNALKDGPYFCQVTFKENEERRCDANAKELCLISFDLDAPDDANMRYVRNFCEGPTAISEALFPYAHVAYVTANSTPENPRLRIVVPVVPCELKNHKPMIAFLAKRLGLPARFNGMRETGVLSQPMYRPAQFLESEFDAVICSNTTGQLLDPKDVPDEIVQAEARSYAYVMQDGDECGLAFLPIRDLSVEDLREPLFAIDPDLSREQWCEVGFALRHQFPDQEDAREAYELYHEWSSGGTEKYIDEEAVWSKWRSFKPYADNRAPITIRSLFRLAMQAGWENKKIATSLKQSIVAWLASCEDEDELMETGCQRIASMPFPNEIVEESLANELRERIAAVTKKPKISLVTIRKQISSVKYIKRKEAATGSIPNWLSPMVFIGPKNEFINAATGVCYAPAGFDNYFSIKLMPTDSDSEQARTGRPLVTPTSYALNQMDINRVDGTMYSPKRGGEPFFTYDSKRLLNTYLLSSLPAEDAKNSEAAGKLFVEHMSTLIGEEEYRDIVIDFLCHIVQKPGHKIRWQPIIQSAEGVGKSFLGQMMKAVMGKNNVTSVSPDVLQDKWTSWMANSVFTILEEVYMPGKVRETVTNSIKMFISDDDLMVVGKFEPARLVDNETNSIAFTNYHDGIAVKSSDRRHMFIESPLQRKDQVAKLNASGHFEKMEILTTKWGGALRHWMLNRKIAADFPVNGPAPITRYRDGAIQDSKNRMQIAIEDMIADPEETLVQEDIIHEKYLSSRTEQAARNNHPATHWLKSLGFVRWKAGRPFEVNGSRTVVWVRRDYNEDFGDPVELLAERLAETAI